MRPTFSSNWAAVPVHTFAFILSIYVVKKIHYFVKTNESIRSVIGLCKTTEVRNDEFNCVARCKDPEAIPIRDAEIFTSLKHYCCYDKNADESKGAFYDYNGLYYDGFLF